jgi:hypothetical protein
MMGCEFKTNVKLDYIQDFEMMFERMKVDRPREAAVYYVTLVVDCPKEFSEFLRVAEEFANITRRPLETGRASLLKYGLIAKVLFSNEADEDFGRESYLPAHPRALWEDIKNNLKQVIAEDTFQIIENRIENYSRYYFQNFEKYGIKLKRNGNVTLQYSGKWILYNVLHNCLEKNNSLKIQVGGEHLFEQNFIKYFKKLLDLDIKIQLIIDNTSQLDSIQKLKHSYQNNLQVRYFADEISGTMRNFVFGKEIAINGIKILPETSIEPSYIGTAYVNLEDIQILDERFNNLWDLAKPLKENKKAS